MAHKIDKQGQENHRKELAQIGIIQSIARNLRYLSLGFVPEFSQPDASQGAFPDIPAIIGYRPMTKEDVSRLSQMLRFETQLLSKLLPDLKAIEVSDLSPNQQPDLSEAELARRLAAVLSSTRSSQGQSQTLANLPDKVPPTWLN